MFKISSILILLVLLLSCDEYKLDRSNPRDIYGKDYNPQVPTLTTAKAKSVTNNSAILGGEVVTDGLAEVTSHGICWDTLRNPTIARSLKKVVGKGTGTFESSVTGLKAGTRYYFSPFATNSVGTGYGKQDSLTTLNIPIVSTAAISSIGQTTAVSGGEITSDGGANITARGVCWSEAANPAISLNTKTTDGTGTGVFLSSITGLTSGRTYHVRAYATNSVGTAYGSDIVFIAASYMTIGITTKGITGVAITSAIGGGTVTSDGGLEVTTRGVCWSAIANPTVTDSKTSDGAGLGFFISNITGLTAGTTYHVRAYATNSAVTSYGTDVVFTTNTEPVIPTVSTTEISNITQTTASGGGNVTSDGGAAVTEQGVCWSTLANPTTTDSRTSDATGIGLFTSSLTGLTSGTMYHVRAYATNSVGTSYGSDISFTTTTIPVIPSITTAAISALTQTTATTGGNVTSDGGENITERGICYNTSSNPTTANSKIVATGTTGTFTSNLTGLTAGTTYYVKAYAINSVGTAYGDQVIFTTSQAVSLPGMATLYPINITSNSATLGGQVISDGNAAVTERGVVYATTQNPTTANFKVIIGAGIGAFSTTVTGLTSGITYYVRAYGINSQGTAYGPNSDFTIGQSQTIPTVITSAATGITDTGARLGGEVTSSGNALVTDLGIVYATTANPTLANTKISCGGGTGIFSTQISNLNAGTTYHVRAYATNSIGTSYGSDLIITTNSAATIPTVTVDPAYRISSSTTDTGLDVSSDGGSPLLEKGICYSTSSSPTIANFKVAAGDNNTGGYGFTFAVAPATTYYLRAYATNIKGTAYSNQITFTTPATSTDPDGNIYNSIIIGTQVWMKENFRSTKYNDGTAIPNVTVNSTWTALTTGAYCNYSNTSGYSDIYGRLYNWYVVSKICPTGWHIPNDSEYLTLLTHLGGELVAGGKLKEVGLAHWASPNTNATGESGFLALPGGERSGGDGAFYKIGETGFWWLSSQSSSTLSNGWYIYNNDGSAMLYNGDKTHGFSIRCLKD